MIVKFWKIESVHSRDIDISRNNEQRAAIDHVDDFRVMFLKNPTCLAEQLIAQKKKDKTTETGTMMTRTINVRV